MAPHSKARNESSSGSESDSDAPEAITHTQAKKHVQKLETSRQSAIKAERESKRAQNQQRDKALKERAEKNKVLVKGKGKGKEKEQQPEIDKEEGSDSEDASQDEDDSEEEGDSEDAGPNGLEARMRRAMMEAQDEESGSDDEAEYEDFKGVQMDGGDDDDESDSNLSEDDDDESESDAEGEASALPGKKSTKFNPNHLPDEIFAAAFACQSNTKRTFTDPDAEAPSRPSKKRKSAANSNTTKDVVVGSRAIRVLSTSSHPKTPSAAPSRKINKFLDRTLALKAGKQRGKGWERRPVNIGVLRRDGGPAANFVRNQAS